MENLGIITFKDNIDSIIESRRNMPYNNVFAFVKEEHERDIQRTTKGTDVHIKFMRELNDYRGKLDMLVFINAPVDFIQDRLTFAKKIAVTNNILLQLGNYKIESTIAIGNHMCLVIEPLNIFKPAPKTVPVQVVEIPTIKEISIAEEVIPTVVPSPVEIVETIPEPTVNHITAIEPIQVVERIVEAEPYIESTSFTATKDLPIEEINPVIIEEIKEEKIEAKEEIKQEEPIKRFAKSKKGRK